MEVMGFTVLLETLIQVAWQKYAMSIILRKDQRGDEHWRGGGGGVKKGDGLFLLLVSLFILFSHYENHRFFKHNCPVCQDLTVNLENDHNALVWLLETCTNKSNLTLGDEFNRSLQFKHLSIFGWFSFLFKCFYRDLFGILAFQQL